MKKTISVTLSNFAFTLDEDAYRKLNEYMEGIKSHFASTDSKETTEEIISDIEASIAEKFSSKLSSSKQVISLSDIDELIKVMGSVEDITGKAGQAEDQPTGEVHEHRKEKKSEESTMKKLYRNPDDVIIAGVASGLAGYFGIDPVFIRLLFFVSIFFGGVGVIIYLVLWLVVPKAETATQKLEMQGNPVTLKKLEKLSLKQSQSKVQ